MRVVFDSNIYISALVVPGGQAEQALFRILDEVLTTLARKFNRDPEALSHTAVMLTELAEVVKPEHAVKVFKDDPDNRVLECAEAGHATVLSRVIRQCFA